MYICEYVYTHYIYVYSFFLYYIFYIYIYVHTYIYIYIYDMLDIFSIPCLVRGAKNMILASDPKPKSNILINEHIYIFTNMNIYI